jgi:RND family efflux transporter MFP subunit
MFNDALRVRLWLPVILLAGFSTISSARADVRGFTSPYKEIAVSAPVTGVVTRMHVREGDTVVVGQPMAELNQDVYRVGLEIAQLAKELRGQREAAIAELRLRRQRLHNLQLLRTDHHASEEEVARAAAEVEMAEAQVLAVEESLQVKALEHQRAAAQLEERIIRSPIDGLIVQIQKEPGEYVSPANPGIVTVVQLSPLLATFSVPAAVAETLATGQQVDLRIAPSPALVTATVEYASPIINAESDTVMVKVRIPNSNGNYRSGQKCVLVTQP